VTLSLGLGAPIDCVGSYRAAGDVFALALVEVAFFGSALYRLEVVAGLFAVGAPRKARFIDCGMLVAAGAACRASPVPADAGFRSFACEPFVGSRYEVHGAGDRCAHRDGEEERMVHDS
jgi:hypothetical protein